MRSAIIDANLGFEQAGLGFRREFKLEDFARSIEVGADQILPGTFEDVRVLPRSSTAMSVSGVLQGINVTLEVTVQVVDGSPVFALNRLNNYPLPIVGALIARGLNQGFSEALEEASAAMASIDISADSIVVVIDGSGTQTVELASTSCVEGDSFSDDFSDIYSGWSQSYVTAQAEVGYKEGAYSLETLKSNIIVNQALPCNFTAFDAAVEAVPVDDPGDASWGLIFFEVNPDNYWVFQINAMGWFAIEQVVDGEHILVVPWTKSDEIMTSDVNVLRVIVDERGEIFSNNNRLTSFDLPPMILEQGGSFGLLLRSGNQANVEVLFDNLEVSQP